MKRSISVLCAAALCCLGCVEVDLNLGGNLVPVDQTYNVYVESRDLPEVNMLIADSLSGYSTTRITIGAIRDEKFGLSTRASAFSIVPLNDTLDFGENPVVRRMHFSSALDTLSTTDKSFDHIMQNVKVMNFSNRSTPARHLTAMPPSRIPKSRSPLAPRSSTAPTRSRSTSASIMLANSSR